MAEVSRTVFIKVVTLDPVRGAMIPVPGVQVRVQHDGFWCNPDLSVGTPVTASDEERKGIAEVELRFEETEASDLDPFITITLPEDRRTVPAQAPESQRFQLPEEWCDRRSWRLPQLLAHEGGDNPAEVVVGFPAELGLSYADFHHSELRNPLAVPEDTLQIYLADADPCGRLNPDDVMAGFGVGVNPETGERRVIPVGEEEEEEEEEEEPKEGGEGYPFLDVWPTAPEAMGDLPARPDAFLDSPRGWIEPPRSWIDPPGAPVGALGGGSFEQTGPLTVDSQGFVWMLDGHRIRRFYPDGTLGETVEVRRASPVGLAADTAGNLFVAAGLSGVVKFWRAEDGQLRQVDRVLSTWTVWPDDPMSMDPYQSFSVGNAKGVAASDGLLLVADAANRAVWVFSIAGYSEEDFGHLGTMRRSTTGAELFQRPVAVAMDRQGRLYVGDELGRQVLCLTLERDASENLLGKPIWVRAGGEEFSPQAIAIDEKNAILYVLESGGRPIRRLDAGTGEPMPPWTPTPAANAVAVDQRGEVYVAAGEEPRVRRFTDYQPDGAAIPDGAEPRPAGAPWLPASADRHMSRPGYVAFDDQGQLWVSDTGNHRVLMFQRNASGELERSRILSDGLSRPLGLARGPEGELFVAVSGTNRVRRYDASLNDSEDFDETFQEPGGLAIGRRDGELRLYVADKGRDRVAILGLDGTALDPITTDGTTALSEPEDVAVDSRHNLYVADTGNQRLVCFPAAAGETPRAITLSAHGLSFSQPCGVAVDDEDRLLVTDRERNMVFRLAADGTLLEFWDLECLVHHSLSTLFQAPFDGIARYSAGLAVEATVPHLGRDAWRVTATGELRIEGSEGRSQSTTLPVGSVLVVRDEQRVEGSEMLAAVASKEVYHPELARRVQFQAPSRAVMDSRGLLAVADLGNDRIRLVRVRANVDVNLFDLGESKPDISRRMRTRADWFSELGLRLAVGDDVDRFGECYESVTDPEAERTEDFTLDRFRHRDVFRSAGKINTAVNVLKVVRQAQRFHRHLTAAASEEQDRWGRAALTLFADLSDSVTWSSSYSLRDVIGLARDLSGRGSDAWEDRVVVHEMAHWVFCHLLPRPAYLAHSARYQRTLEESAGDHWANEITSQDLALNDGFSEFCDLFWRDITDRVRGFPSSVLLSVWRGLAHDRDQLDLFELPGRGLENEGYFTNTVWQIFHALIDPGILFADCPAHWYPRNLVLTEAQSRRYVDLLRKPLRTFAADAISDRPVEQYLTAVLNQAGTPEYRDLAHQIIQSIFELNNQLMPVISITEGTSDSAPGTALGEEVELGTTDEKRLIVQVTDAAGKSLRGYNLRIHVEPGDPGHFRLRAGDGPEARHGVRILTSDQQSAGDRLRATNVHGIVNIDFTAPADSAGSAETLMISYRPHFETDETFSQSPQSGDDWETTLRKLYLRALGDVGPPGDQGPEVTKRITFRIR